MREGELNFQDVDKMSPDEEDIFFHCLLSEFRKEDDSAMRCDLAAGAPVYYRDKAFKEPGHMVKEYPSGRKELIQLDENFEEQILQVLN